MHKNANYRKLNDGSQNSSTYHKKDGTPIRTILKRQLAADADETINKQKANNDQSSS